MKPVQGPKTDVLTQTLADQNEQILVPAGLGAKRYAQPRLCVAIETELTLSAIDAALHRLNAGTYGICACCGAKIGLARLEANPITTLCIDCDET